ncbi:hypothetical protein GPALN_010288 [Globodera pallida]|nr:hypothetical protein GPALN_010288 [Globodera pallida]
MSATGKVFLLEQQPAIKFFKRHFLLSNHHPAQIRLDFGEWGIRTVPSSEHGYFAVRAWQFNDGEQFEHVLNDCAAGSATDIQSIAVAPTVEVRARVLRVQQGRGAARRRAAVSVEISLNESRHALTQRGVAGNMAGLQQRQDMRVEGLMVPGELYIDHNYILPPYTPFFSRYEWEADGKEAVFPRRLRMSLNIANWSSIAH